MSGQDGGRAMREQRLWRRGPAASARLADRADAWLAVLCGGRRQPEGADIGLHPLPPLAAPHWRFAL